MLLLLPVVVSGTNVVQNDVYFPFERHGSVDHLAANPSTRGSRTVALLLLSIAQGLCNYIAHISITAIAR
jgi:hypothetical protein